MEIEEVYNKKVLWIIFIVTTFLCIYNSEEYFVSERYNV